MKNSNKKSRAKRVKQPKEKPYFSNRLTKGLSDMMNSIYEENNDGVHISLGKLIEIVQLTKKAHKAGKNITTISIGRIYDERGNLI